VFAKGVMCAEDAILAIKNGADGIHVSNHGARQLDTTPATIDVLPEIVRACKQLDPKVPIYFDGCVRKGSDALKALALGADCVFVGRPILFGLATDGQRGVENVLEILN
jgi:isopentenyl diphosphate isomerase/L-lactate dehydrogenase-like FMN-dependent dehydrogenase